MVAVFRGHGPFTTSLDGEQNERPRCSRRTLAVPGHLRSRAFPSPAAWRQLELPLLASSRAAEIVPGGWAHLVAVSRPMVRGHRSRCGRSRGVGLRDSEGGKARGAMGRGQARVDPLSGRVAAGVLAGYAARRLGIRALGPPKGRQQCRGTTRRSRPASASARQLPRESSDDRIEPLRQPLDASALRRAQAPQRTSI